MRGTHYFKVVFIDPEENKYDVNNEGYIISNMLSSHSDFDTYCFETLTDIIQVKVKEYLKTCGASVNYVDISILSNSEDPWIGYSIECPEGNPMEKLRLNMEFPFPLFEGWFVRVLTIAHYTF